ncbi:hypothetical protein PR048_028819 [Dryococelus australis]|uniref:Uncharacterized protein n=1 Tax=Dryococelus australis TaxID=614101 RepID=A0ABQ9GBL9_9NEOP|nr:hypothetical protein PR048_028819 [Dryococelus australis]
MWCREFTVKTASNKSGIKQKASTVKEILKIIQKVQSKPTPPRMVIVKELGMVPSTLNTIMSRCKEILANATNTSSDRKNKKTGRYEDTENPLVEAVSGELESVQHESVDAWKLLLLNLSEYPPSDVHNVDEFRLFFNLLPDRTLAFKGETCHEGKQSKERLTVLAGTNMDAASWECLESQTISNCFKKADFGEDTSTAPLEVTGNCESTWKNVQDAINVSCSFEDFVEADNTATCGLHSVEDLCEEHKCQNSDEEEDGDVVATAKFKPRCSEVAENFENLRSFMTSTSDFPSDVMKSLWN